MQVSKQFHRPTEPLLVCLAFFTFDIHSTSSMYIPASHGTHRYEGAARQDDRGWNGSPFSNSRSWGLYSTYSYTNNPCQWNPSHHTRTEWEVGTTTDAQIQIRIPRERGFFFNYYSGAHQQRMTSCHPVTPAPILTGNLGHRTTSRGSHSTETEGGRVLRNSIMLPFPVPVSAFTFLHFSLFCSSAHRASTNTCLAPYGGVCPFLSTPPRLAMPPTRALFRKSTSQRRAHRPRGIRVFKYRDLGQHDRLGCTICQ